MNKAKPKLLIDLATHESAKFACEHWHYSKCHPSTMQKAFRCGAWEDGKFVGVIIFGMGANPQIGSPYGLEIHQICELTRIAMRFGHKTEISRMVALSLKFLKKHNPGLRLVVSYADSGQGHHGGIYQAGNWIYVGISKGVDTIEFRGKKFHSKGFRTSFPNVGMSDPRVKKIKGTDKHKYLMPLDQEIRSMVEHLKKPYPKRASSVESGTSPDQGERGGESPTDALQSSTNPKIVLEAPSPQ